MVGADLDEPRGLRGVPRHHHRVRRIPVDQRRLRVAGASTMSWVLNAYTIAFAALLIPFGRLADRIGRRRMFLGRGDRVHRRLDVVRPRSQHRRADRCSGCSRRSVPPRWCRHRWPSCCRRSLARRSLSAVAIWGAIGAVAGAAGPTLGALVVEHLSWRWAFFINLPVGIVSFIVRAQGAARRPRSEPRPAARSARRGAAGRRPRARGLRHRRDRQLGLGQHPVRRSRWPRRPRSSPSSSGGAAGSRTRCSTCRCSDRTTSAGPTRRCWCSRSGFNAMFLGNVLFLTAVWHYSIIRAGLAISVGPLIVAVHRAVLRPPRRPHRAAAAARPRRPRLGERRHLPPGSRRRTTPDYLGVYLPAVVLTGLGVALCLPQLSSAAVQGLPADRFGSGSAVNQAVRNLGAHVRRRAGHRVHRGPHAGDCARRLPPGVVAARRAAVSPCRCCRPACGARCRVPRSTRQPRSACRPPLRADGNVVP